MRKYADDHLFLVPFEIYGTTGTDGTSGTPGTTGTGKSLKIKI
jgi:hypothetical protein